MTSSSAFPSSSSTPRRWKHDVFLSFRGPDTRRSITNDIYDRLQNRGIKAYRDDQDLEVGNPISPSLLEAIEESRFAIVVLSPNYASSTWCLEELAKICECMEENNRILPLFYNMEPSEVRHQLGSFKEAFDKHESSGRHTPDQVKQWRDALNKVASFSGWDTKNYRTDQELLKEIVDYVCQRIQPFDIEICSVPSQDYLAFESRISVVKEIMKELRNPNTNKIGVWGVGGVGKTTLAKEVYRQANEEKLFDGVVIIVDVKNYSGPQRNPTEKYTERIQKEIAEKLNIDVRECLTEKGRARHLWHKLKEKKILVILDDVWERIEMEEVGIPPTCKLLFTSRSRDRLFSEMGIQKDFGLHTLGEVESWSLFEKMAGGVVKDEPIREKAILVSKKCEGLPILVVTVARALSNCSTLHEWKDALRRLKKLDLKSSEEKPLLTLEWSYNQLDTEELKSLFLLCGILASSKWNNSIYLDDCFKYSMGLGLLKNIDTMEEARDAFHSLIKKLQNYCLLLEHLGGSKKFVRMHELLRNVAIRIARRDKHALLSADDEFKAWPNKEFFSKCTMIRLRQSKIPKLPQVPWECRELKMLILSFSNDSVASVAVPGNFFEDMKKLKVLDLSGLHIPSLPPSLLFLTNLQTLCLDRCVLEDIALVGQLRNLEILSFLKSKIEQLPEEIGQLTRLRLLDLTGCSELVLIPPDVLSSLESLEDLRMGKDSFRLWEAEGNVGSKRTNASLSELTQLSKLTALDIHIPDASFLPSGLFLHLKRYHVLIGEAWEWLPFDDSFNTLKLKLATSEQLDRGLKMLVKRSEHLYLDVMEGVNNIIHLLNNDGSQHLKHLQIKNSADITYFINHNAFQSLESLSLLNLPELVTLSSKGGRAGVTTKKDEQFKNEIGCPSQLFNNGEGIELVAPAISFKNLTTLEVIGCQRLEYLIICSISQSLMQLTRLVVRACESLRNIFPASVAKGLQQLRELKVIKCDRVEEIVATEGVGMTSPTFVFPNATYVEFRNLPQLTSFYPGMHTSVWPLLEDLRVGACKNVEIFALEFSRFQVQPELDIVGTPSKRPLFLIQKGSFYNLKSLVLWSRVGQMKNWWSLLPAELFSKLKTLGSNQPGVFHSGFLQKLPHLEELFFMGFEKEVFVHQRNSSGEIQTVGTPLPHLKKLGLINMPELTDLGKENSLPVIPNLEYLEVCWCAKLKNLMSSAISYQNLQTLEVTECDELEYLMTSSMAQSLTQLTRLEVKDCQGLIEIVTNSKQDGDPVNEIAIKSLQSLKLSGLPSLQGFCSGNCIVKLPSLGTLTVTDCLIELKISPDKLLLSISKPERLKLIEEEAKVHDKPERSGTK